ncbi:MAG: thiamine pyrophosphate-dependent enzyme [Candidatus Aenigmarchaeota archaeon]|nr:thiamine pyrophosphate-dependent enzyme [Candidatus Aenigmarchaeota archaeon]
MEMKDFDTEEIITWCPGCLNHAILNAAKKAFTNLVNKNKIKKENIVAVTGIGCAAKIFDYINVSSFYGIHGRVMPMSMGIKVGNPELTVVGFAGDGDTYAEGIGHLPHVARKNVNMTMIVHDNQIFALTTGQTTPTSALGDITKTSPFGVMDRPLNPIAFAIVCGATFVARVSTLDPEHMAEVFEKAIEHKGFSFVEVFQPCLIFHNNISYLSGKTYKLDKPLEFNDAIKKAYEWNYTKDEKAKIPLGIFYQTTRSTFEDNLVNKGPWHKVSRKIDVDKIVEEYK